MQNLTDDNPKIENNLVLPVLAVRGLVFFPGMMLQFDVARKKSVPVSYTHLDVYKRQPERFFQVISQERTGEYVLEALGIGG